MRTIRIAGGRIVDPTLQMDRPGEIWIVGDMIAELGEPGAFADRQPDQTVDATNQLVLPGLIDMQVHVKDPGFEKAESISSAARAAVAGGFATIAVTPDSEPPIDNEAAAEYVVLQGERASLATVLPMGCLTKNRAGEEVAEIGQLSRAGAVAFTDADRPVARPGLFRKLLQYASIFDKPVVQMPMEPTLAGGFVHAGHHAIKLGMAGIPASAEEVMIARDTILARETGCSLHVASVSTKNGIELLRRAKNDGVPVTTHVTPHHLTLTDELIGQYDPAAHKMLPPLRSPEHVAALLDGLRDGTIDAVASDHYPVPIEDKGREYDLAPFSVIGLETTLAVLHTRFVLSGQLPMSRLVELLATNPARILRQEKKGSFAAGNDADVTIFDPNATWTVDRNRFASRSRNTPYHGETMHGRATYVLVRGRLHESVPAATAAAGTPRS